MLPSKSEQQEIKEQGFPKGINKRAEANLWASGVS